MLLVILFHMKRDLISILDVKDDLLDILELAGRLKERTIPALTGKTLGMIFEKSSTRTRVSFEVAMWQLGGYALYLGTRDLQIGRGETIADTAKVLSRYVDGIMYRAFEHSKMVELARNASVPVINGLDDIEHPCQTLADLLTIKEKKERFDLKLAYIGDGNNVCNSLILGSALVNMAICVATPMGYDPEAAIVKEARRIAGGAGIEILTDPTKAVRDADVVYTDVWVSMGDETEMAEREKALLPYQINAELIAHAKTDCIVMHCLPAHRGMEITDEVIDGKHSVVFDQAENRLHVQKAVLVKLMAGGVLENAHRSTAHQGAAQHTCVHQRRHTQE